MPTADPQVNLGPTNKLTQKLAVGDVRGHAPVQCRSVNFRSNNGPTSVEETNSPVPPLELLGRESDRVGFTNIHREDAKERTGLVTPGSCCHADPMEPGTRRLASQ